MSVIPDIEQARKRLDGETIVGPDGFERSRRLERDLNQIAAKMFAVQGADQVLAWLKSITVNRTFGPGVSDDVLRHHAGQSYIVALIERRIIDGRSGKPDPAPQSAVGRGKRKPAAPAS